MLVYKIQSIVFNKKLLIIIIILLFLFLSIYYFSHKGKIDYYTNKTDESFNLEDLSDEGGTLYLKNKNLTGKIRAELNYSFTVNDNPDEVIMLNKKFNYNCDLINCDTFNYRINDYVYGSYLTQFVLTEDGENYCDMQNPDNPSNKIYGCEKLFVGFNVKSFDLTIYKNNKIYKKITY